VDIIQCSHLNKAILQQENVMKELILNIADSLEVWKDKEHDQYYLVDPLFPEENITLTQEEAEKFSALVNVKRN